MFDLPWGIILPGVDDSESPGFHAVDRPVGDAFCIANADGESAVVCSDQVDGGARLALDLQGGALATILGQTIARRS